jgi:hypothetical protein
MEYGKNQPDGSLESKTTLDHFVMVRIRRARGISLCRGVVIVLLMVVLGVTKMFA